MNGSPPSPKVTDGRDSAFHQVVNLFMDCEHLVLLDLDEEEEEDTEVLVKSCAPEVIAFVSLYHGSVPNKKMFAELRKHPLNLFSSAVECFSVIPNFSAFLEQISDKIMFLYYRCFHLCDIQICENPEYTRGLFPEGGFIMSTTILRGRRHSDSDVPVASRAIDSDELYVRTPQRTPQKLNHLESPEKRSKSVPFFLDDLLDLPDIVNFDEHLVSTSPPSPPSEFVVRASLRESFAQDERETLLSSMKMSNDNQLFEVIEITGRIFVLPEPEYFVYGYTFRNLTGEIIEAQSDLQYLCDHATNDVVQMVRQYDANNGIFPRCLRTTDEFGNSHVSFFRYPSNFDIISK